MFGQSTASEPENSAPPLALSNTITGINENTDTTARPKVGDIAVINHSLGTNTLAPSGTDAALFQIGWTELFLRPGSTLNFGTQVQLDVTVTDADRTIGATPDASVTVSIELNDLDKALVPSPEFPVGFDTGALALSADGAWTVADCVTVAVFDVGAVTLGNAQSGLSLFSVEDRSVQVSADGLIIVDGAVFSTQHDSDCPLFSGGFTIDGLCLILCLTLINTLSSVVWSMSTSLA